jgi:multidrug efflux system outer membrane protein
MRRANEAARAELLSSQEARHTVMLTVVADVASSYVELLERDNELAMAQQVLASLKDSLALTEQRFSGGSSTDLDVARARADLAAQAAEIPELERTIATLENSLSTLVGRNPGHIERGTIDKLRLIAVPQGVPSDVLTRRPDVMAAEATLRAANARIGVAKGEYFPKFALTGYLGQSSDLVRWLLAKTATAGLLDLDLAGPILSFGKVQGTVREARAVTRQEEQRYLQAVRNAIAEVDNALVFNAKSAEHMAAVGEQLAARRQVAALSQARYEGGSATNLDVFNAQRGVYETQVLQGQGMRDQYLALIAVYKALGGGWMVAEDSKALAQASAGAVPIAASTQFPTTTHDVHAQ